MKKNAAVILFLFFLCGCMSSPDRKYYQFYLEGEGRPAPKTIEKTILVEQIKVDDLYDDFRIVYRLSPYQLSYYSYEFWADKPAKLIRDSITHYLMENNVFRKVIQEISQGEPEILLKSKIHFVEEVDTLEVWYARLAMEIELVDFKSREILFYYQFDRKERLNSKSISLVPIVLSNILEEELATIVRNFSAKFE